MKIFWRNFFLKIFTIGKEYQNFLENNEKKNSFIFEQVRWAENFHNFPLQVKRKISEIRGVSYLEFISHNDWISWRKIRWGPKWRVSNENIFPWSKVETKNGIVSCLKGFIEIERRNEGIIMLNLKLIYFEENPNKSFEFYLYLTLNCLFSIRLLFWFDEILFGFLEEISFHLIIITWKKIKKSKNLNFFIWISMEKRNLSKFSIF